MGKMVDALINTLGILALGFICACLIVGGSQCLAWAFWHAIRRYEGSRHLRWDSQRNNTTAMASAVHH